MNRHPRLADLIVPLRPYVHGILKYNRDTRSDRHAVLTQAATFVADRLRSSRSVELCFICTHNSRRSHLAHLWAYTAAQLYGFSSLHGCSGGTEATSCNPRTVGALERAGFEVTRITEGTNPRYLVRALMGVEPVEIFSKVYSENGNPLSGFAAMMCCADVDTRCPNVVGAAIRVPLHYDDPKSSDGTPSETGCYDERCLQIGRDMFALMALVDEKVRV